MLMSKIMLLMLYYINSYLNISMIHQKCIFKIIFYLQSLRSYVIFLKEQNFSKLKNVSSFCSVNIKLGSNIYVCKRKIPSIPFGVALFFSRSAESTETVRNANRSEHDRKVCRSLVSAQNFRKRTNLMSLLFIYEFCKNFN